jgi:glycosyltransferase involved in cell wall biosynthesis
MILNAEGLAQNGKFEESRQAFQEILDKEPNNVRSLLGFGIVCFKLGDTNTAVDIFNKILELKKNHLEAYKNLVLVYTSLNNQDMALNVLDKLITIRQKDPEILSFAAKIHQTFGEKNSAQDYIDKALELVGTNYVKEIEYNDIKALINGLPLPSKTQTKINLTVCCAPGIDTFIHENIKRLSLYMKINTCVSNKQEDFIKSIINSNVVWLEWGNQLTKVLLSQANILQNKKIIVRIHGFEVYDGLVEQINFSLVNDIVFVSAFMRDLFIKKNIPSAQNCKLHVLHNGLDTKRFSYLPRADSQKNIAFLAYISYKNDPMVMIHAFSSLAKDHPNLKLHIGGAYQDSRYQLAIPHLLAKAGLSDRVVISEQVSNSEEWLKDKDYILCSSLIESQEMGLLEAMSRGLKPLIYNFPGSEDIYPLSYLWTTFDDLRERYTNPPNPKDVSDFVAKYYSKEREIAGWLKIILNNELVDEKFDFS